MLNQEQCENALGRIINDDYDFPNDIYGEDKASAFDKDIDIIEQVIEKYFELKEKYNKLLDDVHDYRHETHCMKLTIRNLCEHFGVKNEKELKNIYLCKPYTSEDLREGMLVWHDIEKELIRINAILTKEDCKYLYCDENKRVFFDDVHEHAREFEDGRFYPPTKALQYQK